MTTSQNNNQGHGFIMMTFLMKRLVKYPVMKKNVNFSAKKNETILCENSITVYNKDNIY